MKKRSAKKETKFRRLFNKMGMTYVELICALALLSLVVVMFTPMLLSSYETLYVAGEKVEEVYDSKVEIEGGLAARSSVKIANIGMTFKLNSEVLFENMNIAGRRITSHFQSELETVFHGVRARVDLLTPDVVYDDTSWHDVILQTTGLDWDSEDVILFNHPTYRKNLNDLKDGLKPGQILIDVIKPDKSYENPEDSSGTGIDSAIYTEGDRVNIVKDKDTEKYIYDVDPVSKKISFRFDGADFTNSPIKICVYYVNERGVLKTLSDYLYIKPAHIIFAGQGGGADYFTSAGIEQVDISTGEDEDGDGKADQITQYELNIEGRGMSLHNSTLIGDSDSPKNRGITINTVQWIDNDEQKGFDPYYVMAGSNGSVYRMYNMNSSQSLQTLLGTKNAVEATSDVRYNIDTGESIYPSFWSGEVSDQYYFRTESKAAGYGTEPDNSIDCSSETSYNTFDTRFKYIMAFSGMRTGYQYRMQASRRMSYVLTEANAYSFRFAGKKTDPNNYTGYTAVWEPLKECYVGPGEEKRQWTHFDEQQWDVDPGPSTRIIAGDLGNPYPGPIYFSNKGGIINWSENKHYETNLAYISAMSYTSVPVHNLDFDVSAGSLFNRFYGVTSSGENGGFFWAFKGEDSQYEEQGKTIEKSLFNNYASEINIQSAVYLPGSSSSGKGQVIYFGTVPAYSLVRQSSDIGKPDRYMYNGTNIRNSRCTLFYILSNGEDGAYVAKLASENQNHMGPTSDLLKWQVWNIFHQDKVNDAAVTSAQNGWKGVVEGLGSGDELFTKGNKNQSYFYHDPDLQFTFGYCSRWRMAQGSVTSNGTTEATKSYESFYTDSHTTEKYERVPSSINGSNEDNMYYNVWFPGEHYTLTQTATLDEVTVAVGYTVSGSSFMEQSSVRDPDCSKFYGTALGSVYNDGVLAAYTSANEYKYSLSAEKGGQTNIFDNLLYYKSPDFTNDWTHSRENVRFTTVGLNAESVRNGNTDSGTKQYFAYYGDNNGKVYRSLVATANVTFQGVAGTDEDDIITEKVTLVGSIPDTKVTTPITSSANNGMEEILVNGSSVSQIFSQVTSIEAADDLIIITGNPNSEGLYPEKNCFVVGVKERTGNWTWKVHEMQFVEGDATGNYLTNCSIHCGKIIGNYYYAASDGWFGGINLDVFRNLPNKQPVPIDGYNENPTDDRFFWVDTGGAKIYAIGGYSTN